MKSIYICGCVFLCNASLAMAQPDPTCDNPVIGFILDDETIGVAASGNTVFIGRTANGGPPDTPIAAYDVTDPLNPILLDAYQTTSGSAYTLEYADQHLYFANGPALSLNVSDPSNLPGVQQFNAGLGLCGLDGLVLNDAGDRGIVWAGTGFGCNPGLVEIAIPTPGTIQMAGSLPSTGGALGIPDSAAVQGNISYSSSFDRAGSGGIRFDIHDLDATNNSRLGGIVIGTSSSTGLAYKTVPLGDTVYICEIDNGASGVVRYLTIMDVSDPTTPVVHDRIDIGYSIWDAEVVGDVAWLACGTGLSRDPTSPTVVALDISDPRSPFIINEYTVYTGAFYTPGIDVEGDRVYMTVFDRGLYILDFSGCSTPCLPDTNGDGTLSPADFSAWVAAFNAMSPACDQNGDHLCTPADFSAWVANYNAGC